MTYVTFYTKLEIMTLYIAYENEPCSLTAGRNTWLLFSVRDMSCGLINPCFFLSFLWSVVCKWPITNVTLLTLKIATQNTKLMGYFPIVLMKLFEIYMFELDLNTNLRHLWSVFLLVRVTYATFFYEIAYYDFIDYILE